jgi:hypothetical protein
MKNNKFRVWYKPDIEKGEPLKFIQKFIDDESNFGLFFVMEKDEEFRYAFELPFFDDDWIIEQYTGFKDSHGNEIYEGDRVFGETRNDPKEPRFDGIVEWHEPTGAFLIRNGSGFTRGMNSLYNAEIKGNKYEKLGL